ncbi:hypothetical protein EK21DRAFT_93248 [Setomelanomma holmii]|uniref:Uncharacterized protein n=1 Tax=Setomelanomma holmii TaxID=210430 RepID=A0A9P4H1P1_9PLEO|nr:hypothetical protein EK21DRAFT_93248 [Setomelanomma holmii]
MAAEHSNAPPSDQNTPNSTAAEDTAATPSWAEHAKWSQEDRRKLRNEPMRPARPTRSLGISNVDVDDNDELDLAASPTLPPEKFFRDHHTDKADGKKKDQAREPRD